MAEFDPAHDGTGIGSGITVAKKAVGAPLSKPAITGDSFSGYKPGGPAGMTGAMGRVTPGNVSPGNAGWRGEFNAKGMRQSERAAAVSGKAQHDKKFIADSQAKLGRQSGTGEFDTRDHFSNNEFSDFNTGSKRGAEVVRPDPPPMSKAASAALDAQFLSNQIEAGRQPERSSWPLQDYFAKIITGDLARKSKFRVAFALPKKFDDAWKGKDVIPGPDNLKTQGIFVKAGNYLSVLCESISMPGKTMLSQADDLLYGPPREMGSGPPVMTDITAVFQVAPDLRVKQIFEAWHDLMIDQVSWHLNYYSDYVGGMQIFQLDRSEQDRYGIQLYEVFPKTVTAMDMGWSQQDAYQTIQVVFSYRNWAEIPVAEAMQFMVPAGPSWEEWNAIQIAKAPVTVTDAAGVGTPVIGGRAVSFSPPPPPPENTAVDDFSFQRTEAERDAFEQSNERHAATVRAERASLGMADIEHQIQSGNVNERNIVADNNTLKGMSLTGDQALAAGDFGGASFETAGTIANPEKTFRNVGGFDDQFNQRGTRQQAANQASVGFANDFGGGMVTRAVGPPVAELGGNQMTIQTGFPPPPPAAPEIGGTQITSFVPGNDGGEGPDSDVGGTVFSNTAIPTPATSIAPVGNSVSNAVPTSGAGAWVNPDNIPSVGDSTSNAPLNNSQMIAKLLAPDNADAPTATVGGGGGLNLATFVPSARPLGGQRGLDHQLASSAISATKAHALGLTGGRGPLGNSGGLSGGSFNAASAAGSALKGALGGSSAASALSGIAGGALAGALSGGAASALSGALNAAGSLGIPAAVVGDKLPDIGNTMANAALGAALGSVMGGGFPPSLGGVASAALGGALGGGSFPPSLGSIAGAAVGSALGGALGSAAGAAIGGALGGGGASFPPSLGSIAGALGGAALGGSFPPNIGNMIGPLALGAGGIPPTPDFGTGATIAAAQSRMKAAAAHAANAFGASRVAIPGMQSMPSISAGSFANISFPRIQGGTGANAVPNLGSMGDLLSRALTPKNLFGSQRTATGIQALSNIVGATNSVPARSNPRHKDYGLPPGLISM